MLFCLLLYWGGVAHMNLDILANQPHYKVGEPIYFQVIGSENHYLYMFNLDDKTGKLYLSLGPELHWANETYSLPDPNFEMLARESGVEHFIFVTSPHPLQLPAPYGYGEDQYYQLNEIWPTFAHATVSQISLFIND